MKPIISYVGAGALLVSGLFLTAPVQAQTTTSETFSTTTPQPTANTDWTTTFSLPQFDPSQGTLNEVIITVDSTMNTQLTVQNNGPSPDSGHAFTEIEFFVDDSGLNLNGAGNPALTYNSPNFNFDNLASGDSVTSGILSGHGTSVGSSPYTSPTVLSEFTGTGTISLNGSTETTTVTATSGANTSANQSTTADGNVSVTYDYTVPTPEPTTLGLIALGGGVACFFRRRQSR